MKKKIGLFFGSFNPITTGHMIVANIALQDTDLDELWIVVSPGNPAKIRKGILIDAKHRLKMAEKAVEGDKNISVSDIEFQLNKEGAPSFTHLTLRHLREKYPDTEFPIVCGSDTQQMIAIWRSADEIAPHHKTIHYPRNFTPRTFREGTGAVERFAKIQAEATNIDAPNLDFSSTYIRKRIKAGKGIKYLVPNHVEEYINKHNLFKK